MKTGLVRRCCGVVIVWICLAQAQSATAEFDSGRFMGNLHRELASYRESDSSLASTVSLRDPAPQRSEHAAVTVLRIIGYLVVLTAVFMGLAWLMKRGGIAGKSRIGGGSMDILEVLPLGPQRTVVLLRVLDCVYLLGQTPQNITVLEKLEGQKALEVVSSSRGAVSLTKFKDALNTFVDKFKRQV